LDLPTTWAAAKGGDPRAIEALVVRYHWLPAKIARSKRVPPHFDREDVVSWANGGLFDAVRKFDPNSGNGQLHEHFIGYATLRINGAILDGMKAPGQSWATRAEWRKVKQMHLIDEDLTHRLGRPATKAEIAAAMGVDVAHLPLLQQQVHLDAAYNHSDDMKDDGGDFDGLPSADSTAGSAEIADIADRLASKLVALPQQAQQVLQVLFHEGGDLRAVMDSTGLTLGRVRKLRSESLLALRDVLQRS
jgi:RNA polymerase sigma factor (sigma-70 family)